MGFRVSGECWGLWVVRSFWFWLMRLWTFVASVFFLMACSLCRVLIFWSVPVFTTVPILSGAAGFGGSELNAQG